MKRIALLLFFSLTCATMSWAQSEKRAATTEDLYKLVADRITGLMTQGEKRSAAAQEQYVKRIEAMDAKDYQKAAEAGEKELQLLRQQSDCTDSLQIDLLARLGFVYEYLGNLDKSIAVTQEGIELCRTAKRENTSEYGTLYSNLAYYYSLLDKKQEALDNSKKSADIFLRLMTNDWRMAVSLMRAAHCCYDMEKYSDAVLYQENGCQIMSQARGRHSQDYLKGLDNLIACYKAANMEEKVAETEALKAQLMQENKTGYVPMAADLSSGEKCRQHNEDAYYASLYYQQHPFSADSMLFVSKYIYNFTSNSDDVHVLFGEGEKWVQDEKSYPYLIAYMSGFVTHQLRDPNSEITMEAYANGVAALLAAYSNNRHITGELPVLEEMLNSFKKDREKFWKKRNKDFQVYEKAIQKGQTSRGDSTVIDF